MVELVDVFSFESYPEAESSKLGHKPDEEVRLRLLSNKAKQKCFIPTTKREAAEICRDAVRVE